MIHLYYGDGKGKTTAAVGLALRAAGSGLRVLFVQFFKAGDSGEIKALSHAENVEVFSPAVHYGRYKMLSDAQKAAVGDHYGLMLNEVIERASDYDLIVLDEAAAAYRYAMIDNETLLSFLQNEGQNREIVLTGRDPAPELLALADYATEMRKVKHPYDRGVAARKGIEF